MKVVRALHAWYVLFAMHTVAARDAAVLTARNLRGALVALLSVVSVADAAPVTVTIDTSAHAGTSAMLAIDFIDGGTPSNAVTVTGFATDGSLGAAIPTGDVTGTLPGDIVLSDASFFTEYLQIIVLGTSISFAFEDTGLPPDAGASPDALSVFLLDSSSGLPLDATADPTGADALFFKSLDGSGIELYSSTVTLGSTPVPEPASLALLLVTISLGVATLCGGRGTSRWRGFYDN